MARHSIFSGKSEAGAGAARLVHDEGRQAVAYRVGEPALAAVGRRVERRSGVAGAVHHDQRILEALFRDLELHVGLADDQLLGLPDRRGRRGIVRHLGHAADEESALIADRIGLVDVPVLQRIYPS